MVDVLVTFHKLIVILRCVSCKEPVTGDEQLCEECFMVMSQVDPVEPVE